MDRVDDLDWHIFNVSASFMTTALNQSQPKYVSIMRAI